MRIIFFGDIVGRPGREAVAKILPEIKKKHQPDLVMGNVENLAHGLGVTMVTIGELLAAGVDFFTSGNHVFDKPEYERVFAEYGDRIVRPANFAPEFPGNGYKLVEIKGEPVLIANLLGEVFMEDQVDQGPLTSPFDKVNEILDKPGQEAKIRILDFHAEATSEMRAMGFHVDGRMSAVAGTHTHVPTADAQILPGGTGYITDIGMTGAAHSVIGWEVESVLERFRRHDLERKKTPLEIAVDDKKQICYVLLEIDRKTGKCKDIRAEYRII